MNTLTLSIICLGIGLLANLLSLGIKSSYLPGFLGQNLVVIIAALLAINVTTTSLIITKLRELREKYGGGFDGTLSELRISLNEQLYLVGIALLLLIVRDSEVLKDLWSAADFFANTLLTGIFCFAVYCTYDTSKAVFLLMDTSKGHQLKGLQDKSENAS